MSFAVQARAEVGARPHRHHARSSSTAVGQRVAKHQLEVQRLQQDVAKQELAGKQASERLQKQDQTISELQTRLQQAQARPVDGQH
jgi:hypothetical protein